MPAALLLLFAPFAPWVAGQAAGRRSDGPVLSRSNDDQSLLPGLVATYSDRNHRLRLVVPTPNFYLEARESVHPSLASAFEAEWTGLISILQTGAYTIEAAPAEVYINGEPVTGKGVELSSGRHPIRIRFSRGPGTAALRLRWSSTHFPLEPIPSSRFSHPASATPGEEDALVELGRYLVEEFGCVNCHKSNNGSLTGRLGPHLSGIGSRVNPSWIYKWLQDPGAYRANATMPVMLDEQGSRDVASYLASLTSAAPSPEPNRSSRRDVSLGIELYGSLGCTACHQQEGVSLDGVGSKTSVAVLASYLKNPATVEPSGRMPSMMLTDEEAFQIAAFLAESVNADFEQPFEGGDPGRGKALVQSAGCLACHRLDDQGMLSNQHRAPALEKLSPDRGCLAVEPGGSVPRYRLTARQRAAMQAFLRSFQRHPDVSPAPVYEFRRNVERLGCVTCHEFDHTGPRAALPEMAPPLTDAGAKLRTQWLSEVLTNRKRVLGHLHLRMPDYEPGQVQALADGFAKAAGVKPGDGPEGPSATAAQRDHGAGMIGTNPAKGGLACIGCHDWGEHKSLGENGPQLINAAERLRHDWFRRWMLDPARILSGTSMPNYFSSMESEKAYETIDALWAALSMGKDMPLPDGFAVTESGEDSEAKPTPGDKAVVVRWDMPEATPAAIAVGMPGGVSYCFDAGESRLRYAWMGGFIDLTGTLLRKRDPKTRLTPTADLIGEIFYRSDEFPLRVGALDRIPQRRFRGYRMVDGYPRFHYEADGIDVHERVVPAPGNDGLIREFTIARVGQPMWFLAGENDGVVTTSTAGEIVNGRLAIPRGAPVRFDVKVIRKPEQ